MHVLFLIYISYYVIIEIKINISLLAYNNNNNEYFSEINCLTASTRF